MFVDTILIQEPSSIAYNYLTAYFLYDSIHFFWNPPKAHLSDAQIIWILEYVWYLNDSLVFWIRF